MKAAEYLATAAELVSGARNDSHGDIIESFTMISKLWSVYLGAEVTPTDVARCFELGKIARGKCGEFNIDDYIDAAGYAAIAGELDAELQ